MHNLLAQFEAAEAPASDEGVVTIEYVLLAVAVAGFITAVIAYDVPAKLTTKLTGILG